MNYSEIIFFDFVVGEDPRPEFGRIVAKRSSDEIFKRFQGTQRAQCNFAAIAISNIFNSEC